MGNATLFPCLCLVRVSAVKLTQQVLTTITERPECQHLGLLDILFRIKTSLCSSHLILIQLSNHFPLPHANNHRPISPPHPKLQNALPIPHRPPLRRHRERQRCSFSLQTPRRRAPQHLLRPWLQRRPYAPNHRLRPDGRKMLRHLAHCEREHGFRDHRPDAAENFACGVHA
jgi:hypothetical protein